MATQWLDEAGAIAALQIKASLLKNWRTRPISILGRPIENTGRGRERLYSAADVQRIAKEAQRPYAPFKDHRGRQWLDGSTLKLRFPSIWGSLYFWNRSNSWPYGRITPREIFCRGTGNIGVSLQRFWPEDEVEKVAKKMREGAVDASPDWLSYSQIKELGRQMGKKFTRWKFWDLAKNLPAHQKRQEQREVVRNGVKMLRVLPVVPRSAVLERLADRREGGKWNRAPNHDEAIELVRSLVATGPILASYGASQCKQRGISKAVMYKALLEGGVKKSRVSSGRPKDRGLWVWHVGAKPASLVELKEQYSTVAKGAPHWDRSRRELWIGSKLCKRFARPPLDQGKILDAFEEEGWPGRIDDPLRPGALRKTLDNMRAGFKNSPIRFSGDGTGEGVSWEMH